VNDTVFLDLNGYDFNCDETALYKKIMSLAKGKTSKDDLIAFFEEHSGKRA
jgi:prophage maintenance system killer protein